MHDLCRLWDWFGAVHCAHACPFRNETELNERLPVIMRKKLAVIGNSVHARTDATLEPITTSFVDFKDVAKHADRLVCRSIH